MNDKVCVCVCAKNFVRPQPQEMNKTQNIKSKFGTGISFKRSAGGGLLLCLLKPVTTLLVWTVPVRTGFPIGFTGVFRCFYWFIFRVLRAVIQWKGFGEDVSTFLAELLFIEVHLLKQKKQNRTLWVEVYETGVGGGKRASKMEGG